MNEVERMRSMIAEMRAGEMLRVLRQACSGAAHWRFEARRLLALIDGGVPPEITEQKDDERHVERLSAGMVLPSELRALVEQPDATLVHS